MSTIPSGNSDSNPSGYKPGTTVEIFGAQARAETTHDYPPRWLHNPELHAKLEMWREEDRAKEARRPHNRDFEGWVNRIAQKFDALDHEGGRIVAQCLRELATEVRILGQHEPISAAEFSARQDVMRGAQEAQDAATLERRLSEGWDIPGEC